MKCPKCGFANAAGKFCSECGSKLPATSAPTEELKTATILFADVSGFTAMSEKLSAEECAAIMKSCFTGLEQAIQNYQGTVIKYVGDCIMASFGIPITLEDHPVRSVFAAVEMQKRLRRFSQQLEAERGFTLRMRIGLNSGEVWVGTVGDKLDLMGTTVNLASRLEHDCSVGGILINESVYRAVESIFQCTPRPPFYVKGISEAVTAFEVGEEKRIKVSTERRALEPPKAFVGRSGELMALKRQVKQLIDGVGSGVAVIGDAGVGKSRLVMELHQQVAFRNLPWLEVESASYRQNIPHWSVVSLLHQLFHIEDDDTEEFIVAKIGDALVEIEEFYLASEFYKNDPERRSRMSLGEQKRVLTDLLLEAERRGSGRLAPTPALSAAIAKAVRQLFRQAALHSKGLVVVCDSLQSADNHSQEALEGLLKLGEDIPLLAIGIYRPDPKIVKRFTYDRTDARAVETEGNIRRVRAKEGIKFRGLYRFVEIALGVLAEEESAQLVAAWLGVERIEPDLLAFVQGKAGGNPYFIEEVINSLVEEGTLFRSNGEWHFKGRTQEGLVPESLREMTAARVDKLGRGAKHTLQLAAVIGLHFSPAILKGIHPQKELVDAHLKELVTTGLIKPAERGEFTFTQPAIQDVAYNALLQRDRATYHGQVAQMIEEATEDLESLIPSLAWHYVRAGAGFEAKAAQYGLKAAREAFARGEMSEAHELGTQLLDAVTRAGALVGPDLGRLHFLIGQTSSYVGDLKKGLQHLQEAQNLLEDPAERAEAETELGLIDAKRAYYDTASRWFDAADASLRSCETIPASVLARLQMNRAWLEMRRHRYKQAEQLCGEVLRILKKDPDTAASPALLARLWNTLGELCLSQRDPDGAAVQFQHTIAVHGKNRRSLELVAALRGAGQAAQLKGETEEARHSFARALEQAESIGNPLILGDTLLALAQFDLWLGALTTVQEHLDRALKLFETVGERLGQADCLLLRAELALRQGQLQAVIDAAGQAQQVYAAIEDGAGEVRARVYCARANSDTGQYYLAEGLGQEAMEVADRLGWPVPRANARLFMGELALTRKRYTEAEELFAGAQKLAEEAADRLLIGRTRLAWGGLHLLGDEAEWPQAQQAVEEALNIFQELGEDRGIYLGRLFLAEWRLRRQEWDAADRLLIALLQKLGNVRTKERGRALLGRSQACLGRNQAEEARQLAEQALDIFEGAGMEAQIGRTLLHLASLYDRLGERTRAEEARHRGNSIQERLTADESGSKVELLLRSLRRDGITFVKTAQGYELMVTRPGTVGSLPVQLMTDRLLPGGNTAITLVRVLERAREDRFREILIGNMALAQGAVGLWEVEGTESFALFESLVADSLCREELLVAIQAVARGGEKWVRQAEERTGSLAASATDPVAGDGEARPVPKESAVDRAKREREHKLVKLVDEAVKDTTIKFNISPVGNTLSLPIDSGHIRAVSFYRNRLDESGHSLLFFTTRGGSATAETYRSALRANAQLCGGGIGLQTIGGTDTFMMAESLLAQYASRDEIVAVVMGLAILGDQLEKGKIQQVMV